MLSCEICAYFKTTRAAAKTNCMCDLTGFVFHKKVEDYEMENYPCYDYQFNIGSVENEAVITYERKIG